MDERRPIALVAEASGSFRLVLSGRVTVADAAQFHQTARELAARGTDLTVCCDAVEYLDAAAVQLVLALGRALTSRGRRCAVTGVAGALAAQFRLVGLS